MSTQPTQLEGGQMLGQVVSSIVGGIAQGIPYFFAAVGLTLILGVFGILNFAQGAYLMLGTYIMFSVAGSGNYSVFLFIVGILVAGVTGAVTSLLTEVVAFRRIYRLKRESLQGIFISVALLLIIEGLVILIWGLNPLLAGTPAFAQGHITVSGVGITKYDVVLIGVGLVLSVLVFVTLRKTRFGKLIIAVSYDRELVESLGISTQRISMITFCFGGLLAGIGGALIAPLGSLSPDLGADYLLFAFIAIALGGLGSVPGALIGSLLIGIASSVMAQFVGGIAPYSIYIVAAVVLIARPNGLFRQVHTERIA